MSEDTKRFITGCVTILLVLFMAGTGLMYCDNRRHTCLQECLDKRGSTNACEDMCDVGSR